MKTFHSKRENKSEAYRFPKNNPIKWCSWQKKDNNIIILQDQEKIKTREEHKENNHIFFFFSFKCHSVLEKQHAHALPSIASRQSHSCFETTNLQVICWAMSTKLYPWEVLEAVRWQLIDNHIVFSA